jgi:hypothetical protein
MSPRNPCAHLLLRSSLRRSGAPLSVRRSNHVHEVRGQVDPRLLRLRNDVGGGQVRVLANEVALVRPSQARMRLETRCRACTSAALLPRAKRRWSSPSPA